MDYLAAFLNYSFLRNKKLSHGKNPDSIYLAGFTEEHIQHLKDQAIEVITDNKRPVLVVECKGRTWRKAISEAVSLEFKTNTEAYEYLENLQKETNTALLVVELSRCKVRTPQNYTRSLIKNIDDAHFKGIYPESDLIFVDYASFLEKHWQYIGLYLRVNTLLEEHFHLYPKLSEHPLRAVK